MSLTEYQIVDVALQVNSPEALEVLSVSIPTINIVATNAGPPGPAGQWVAMTQSEYDAILTPDPDILYVIIQ